MKTGTYLATAVTAFLISCSTPGWRADNGGCPPGENCSDLTPDGLYFEGSEPYSEFISDPSVKTIAVGGVQTIRVLNAENMEPLALPFEADVDGANFQISGMSGAEVKVEASQEGSAYLRIVDPATGELMDMVQVRAAPVDHARVRPAALEIVGDGPRVMYNGSPARIAATLYGARQDQKLADESMVVHIPNPGAGSVQRLSWDALELSGFDPGVYDVSVRTGDGSEHWDTVELVDGVDEVILAEPLPPQSMSPGTTYVCFEARHTGRIVVGLPWSFSVEGPATVEDINLGPNCAWLRVTGPGQVTVTGTALGRSATAEIQVVAQLPAPRTQPTRTLPLRLDVDVRRLGPAPGMRAARAEAEKSERAE